MPFQTITLRVVPPHARVLNHALLKLNALLPRPPISALERQPLKRRPRHIPHNSLKRLNALRPILIQIPPTHAVTLLVGRRPAHPGEGVATELPVIAHFADAAICHVIELSLLAGDARVRAEAADLARGTADAHIVGEIGGNVGNADIISIAIAIAISIYI